MPPEVTPSHFNRASRALHEASRAKTRPTPKSRLHASQCYLMVAAALEPALNPDPSKVILLVEAAASNAHPN